MTTHAERRVTETWTTLDGQTLTWASIDDWQRLSGFRRARLRSELRAHWRVRAIAARRVLAFAIDELSFRHLLPTFDDLRVAWDRAWDAGAIDDPKRHPRCFIELWVGYRGESTLSPEYAAAVAERSAQP